MPTYEYVCSACEHRFERFQKMSEGALRKCPECGRLKLKRLMGTGAGIIFRGSGFYETDYKRKSSGNGKAGGGSVGDAGAAAPETGSSGKAGAGTSKDDAKTGEASSGSSGD